MTQVVHIIAPCTIKVQNICCHRMESLKDANERALPKRQDVIGTETYREGLTI